MSYDHFVSVIVYVWTCCVCVCVYNNSKKSSCWHGGECVQSFRVLQTTRLFMCSAVSHVSPHIYHNLTEVLLCLSHTLK